MARTTTADKTDFAGYCATLSNAQVLAVIEKEKAAGRRAYAAIAQAEAQRRGIA